MALEEIVERCQDLYEDLDFTSVRAWKEAGANRKVIGHMPVYVPRELIHAAGMLPVGILGGGDQLDVIHGDAYYQSYICRIPRSTIELAITGRLDCLDLDCLDGMLFPSTCDVIRNLSGMWQLKFQDKLIRYFDVPQNFDLDIGGAFYTRELQSLRELLAELAGRQISDEDIQASIGLYNKNRQAIAELYAYRAAEPWQVPTPEVYLLMRAGMLLPVDEHTQLIHDYIAAAKDVERPVRDNCRVVINGDNCRVVINGLFCEQPPLGLLKSIEIAGCYVVDDDFMLVARWLLHDVPTEGDPLKNLSDAFITYDILQIRAEQEGQGQIPGRFRTQERGRRCHLRKPEFLRSGIARQADVTKCTGRPGYPVHGI